MTPEFTYTNPAPILPAAFNRMKYGRKARVPSRGAQPLAKFATELMGPLPRTPAS